MSMTWMVIQRVQLCHRSRWPFGFATLLGGKDGIHGLGETGKTSIHICWHSRRIWPFLLVQFRPVRCIVMHRKAVCFWSLDCLAFQVKIIFKSFKLFNRSIRLWCQCSNAHTHQEWQQLDICYICLLFIFFIFSEAMCWICAQFESEVDLRLELMQICLVLVEVRYCKLWIPVSRTCFSEHRIRIENLKNWKISQELIKCDKYWKKLKFRISNHFESSQVPRLERNEALNSQLVVAWRNQWRNVELLMNHYNNWLIIIWL